MDVTVIHNSVGTRSKCTAKLPHNELEMQGVAVDMQLQFGIVLQGTRKMPNCL